MQKTFLEQNPFYILEVTPSEKRTAIISKTEEMLFLSDDSICEDAQAKLLNPEKRLGAELDWFCNLAVETLVDIYNCVRERKTICTEHLDGIERLNAILYNFSISFNGGYIALAEVVLEVDKLYSSISIPQLLSNINACRKQAGMREVTEDELGREFSKKRAQIRQLIVEKTTALPNEDYIAFITMIAEKCIANESYKDGVVISDVVDQYEIRMQRLIEKATEEIYARIACIQALSTEEEIAVQVEECIRQVQKWDRLVQPLQLKSMASGVTHGDSEKIGREIHELSVWLHNERGFSKLSLRLIEAMEPIFAEIGEVADQLKGDSDALSGIIKGNEEAKQVAAQLETLKAMANGAKFHASDVRVTEFTNKVKELNRRVKQLPLEADLARKIRTNICYLARDVAITLHNDKHKTDMSINMTKTLLAEFSDLPEVKAKLTQDVLALCKHIAIKEQLQRQVELAEQRKKSKRWTGLIWLAVALVLAIICGSMAKCDNSKTNDPYAFSQEANDFDAVYVDIVSIVPEYSVSIGSASYITEIVCRCETADGRTVWVYMSQDEYKKNIDTNANFSYYLFNEFDEVYYPSAKRIHGKARDANDVARGLAGKTDTMIVEFSSIE